MSGESAITAMETADVNQNVDKNNRKDSESTDIELQILAVLPSCVTYLRDKADSFTFESVRRLLEERMKLEKYALDVHKSFVEEHLIKCLKDFGNDAASENSEEHGAKNDVREETGGDDDEEKTKGSSENISKTVAEDTNDEGNREALMSDIKRALRKRASYIKDSAETLTLLSLRRILEQDLNLERESLNPFKKFISKELDEVLQIPDASKRSTKPTEKKAESTPCTELGSDENSESDAEDDMDDEEVSVEKTETRKRKCGNGEPVPGKKKAKRIETDSEDDSDAKDDSEMMASSGHSQKPLKIKEAATPVYGKRVERLRSVVKSCGMSVPPVIYRKVKKAPEEKREATLIEELEQILAKEGLSSDPSEKEIKEVKKKKDILKELEGIDTSNIISSSRRRSSASFVPPPMPKIASESESDEPEDSENGEDNEEEEGEEGHEEAEGGSQSQEESNSDDDDDDDGEESE